MPTQLTTGDLVTAANWNSIAAGVLGYAQRTTDAGPGFTTSGSDIGSLEVTVDLPAGRMIKVSMYVGAATASVAGDRFNWQIREGTTQLQRYLQLYPSTVAQGGVYLEWIGTPSAGLHTYKGGAGRASGTGDLSPNADTTRPMFILVEDIGEA